MRTRSTASLAFLFAVGSFNVPGQAAGAQANPRHAAASPPPKEFYFAYTDGQMGPVRALVRTEGEFREYWKRAHTGVPDAPPPPTIEFSKEMVAVVALGLLGAPGHRARIASAVDQDGILDIVVDVHVYGRGVCIVADQDVWPTLMVRLPATQSMPLFHDRRVVDKC
jgi:hypothetical protein